jgi:Zn finger protein HypA/HybF involved in hydrogenase expression
MGILTMDEIRQIRKMIHRLRLLLPNKKKLKLEHVRYTMHCHFCKRQFTASRRDTKFCGSTCRQRNFHQGPK